VLEGISLTDALEAVIAFLDARMEEQPDRATADACNYLQKLLEEESKKE
jgi:hypothetical protein